MSEPEMRGHEERQERMTAKAEQRRARAGEPEPENACARCGEWCEPDRTRCELCRHAVEEEV